jgi:hypothetical protein
MVEAPSEGSGNLDKKVRFTRSRNELIAIRKLKTCFIDLRLITILQVEKHALNANALKQRARQ